MPRTISAAEKVELIELILTKLPNGQYAFGQRDIERQTGVSRPFLRKLAKEVGHQFPRNGKEIQGVLCGCSNCGTLFRKPMSRVQRAKRQFCEEECKLAYMKGSLHPSWKTGKSAASFSLWVKNQKGYKDFVQQVLEKYNHKCWISGRDYDIHVHHILLKSEHNSEALNPDNGVPLNEEVHIEMHKLIREGFDFETCVAKLKERFGVNNG